MGEKEINFSDEKERKTCLWGFCTFFVVFGALKCPIKSVWKVK